MAKKETTQDFETALARLETLIEEMESGSLNLDQMIAHFEEGNKLVKLCGAKLTEVEKKIEKLVKPDDPDQTALFTDEG
ncbi:MAG: exodeoxyribonuclease VII small subunit [Verrucomicrobia bacterium]|nr:exodeoxyribonuclease VII small subunit [Kiritimatiellia bacterium]MCB1101467.1 exodeoxyribonuclease VII small subunit [Kiritimatiellia bacterium]MCP5487146.1 exodeoxyribonuclease VII small subunit [Verrucomicrobiota bacterium]